MWQTEHHSLNQLYELKKTLGRGHFAVVKLAHHVFSGEKVAIKVIDKSKMDKVSADHLYHEVTCMKLVQHPNVVKLYQVIETASKLYLILELGDGGDMFDYIMRHERGLHEDHAKEYFAQIVSAIAYCHKLHVVHRDLKPENVVFFESQGLVKLTDFGFSNRYKPGEKLSTSCGSLAYSAPEILLGEEYDAPAVDVWSLGVILYMLVCGIAPFNEANDSETLINIMDCRYTVLDHVSSACQDLIQRMIIKEPSERIGLNDIITHPWLKGAKSLGRARRNSTPILTRNVISDELHQEILGRMVAAQLADEAEILASLQEDRYDYITSTYFLLAEKKLSQQAESMSCNNSDSVKTDEATLPNLPQPPCSQLDATLPTPCKQSSLLPPSTSTQREIPRSRTTSSSSDDSTRADRRASPSYIREHLTITPRHGFSVIRGGIDTLIEEEERSRSQTTTDDEADPPDGDMVNPTMLASQLQRASVQLKRIKKRRSAPVLNEICEENEGEGDSMHVGSGEFPRRPFASRHSISSTRPNHKSPRHQANSLPSGRAGRAERRHGSHRVSSGETSDEESESSRTSQSTLSSIVSNMMLRYSRDSSEDRDDGGAGPAGGRGDVGEHGAPADGHSGGGGANESTGAGVGEGNSGQTGALNNAMITNLSSKRHILLDGSDGKIINVFAHRSRSVESGVGGSRSARSSSTSLATCRGCLAGNVRSNKNTSSTRSDTRLVLRCHQNNCQTNRKYQNFTLISKSSSAGCVFQSRAACTNSCALHHKKTVNLSNFSNPHPCALCGGKQKALVAGSKYGALTNPTCPHDHFTEPSENPAVVANEAILVKRSNLSIASSTCSESKFAVDPVNELPPSPCPPTAFNGVLVNTAQIETWSDSTNKNKEVLASEEMMRSKKSHDNQTKRSCEAKNGGSNKQSRLLLRLSSYKNSLTINGQNAHRPESSLVKKVKSQDCCSLM